MRRGDGGGKVKYCWLNCLYEEELPKKKKKNKKNNEKERRLVNVLHIVEFYIYFYIYIHTVIT